MHRPCHIIDFDRDCGDFFYVHISLLAPSPIQQELDSSALAFHGASLQPARRSAEYGTSGPEFCRGRTWILQKTCDSDPAEPGCTFRLPTGLMLMNSRARAENR